MAAGVHAEVYDLRDGLNGVVNEAGQSIRETAQEASILILRDVADRFATHNVAATGIGGVDAVFLELLALNWDSKALMKGKVCNKKARWNLCFAGFSQEPDYDAGKGRVYDFQTVPCLNSIREKLGQCFGPKGNLAVAEGNYYYDKTKCYIGGHGDAERRIVIAFRFGASMPLEYQWFQRSAPLGVQMVFKINHNDCYLMSSKSVGHDWKQKIIPTLRHSANGGAAKK
ncbi:MAG: hypothetical protein H0X02_13820 [Nitrosomonas sp.]|nr:hypothetical protein [Nitrosomonas sp.]